jgi:hypothetical protein
VSGVVLNKAACEQLGWRIEDPIGMDIAWR